MAFSVFVILNLSLLQIANAQTVIFEPPPPPPDIKITSGRRTGGSSRGDCPVASKPLTALVPASWKSSEKPGLDPAISGWESVWGLTTAQSPTLWFYVPHALTSKQYIQFVLEDEFGKNVYKTSIAVNQSQPSIMGVKIPSTTNLKVDQKYHWYFLINCDSNTTPWVEGWIQRVAVNTTLKNQLSKASPQQQAAIYATNGIWYDSLNTLAQLRQKNPENPILIKEWTNLLTSVGLQEIASEPISRCCGLTAQKK